MASLTTAEKKLDRVFSKWVRYSASKDNVVRCYTCGKFGEPKNFHASHYIDRTHKTTRWDERNVKPACVYCNTFREGNKDEFALHLIKDYGQEILDELNKSKWLPTKTHEHEILATTKDYEKRLKTM